MEIRNVIEASNPKVRLTKCNEENIIHYVSVKLFRVVRPAFWSTTISHVFPCLKQYVSAGYLNPRRKVIVFS